MKFYLDTTTGKWVVGIYTGVPAGSCTEFTNTNGKIRIEKLSGGVIYNEDGEYDFLPTEFQDKDGNNYADLAAYEAATKDFFLKAPASNGGGNKLDVVFVDYWRTIYGIEGNIFTGAIILDLNVDDVIGDINLVKIADFQNGEPNLILAGVGSNPYVPISKTTIFVHPTTFERYRFNGTTMEVYNDVNNVVPKWLKYEALLTQTGEDAPVARVLNQDEADYLGDIEWVRDDIGSYKSNILVDASLIVFDNAYNDQLGTDEYGEVRLTKNINTINSNIFLYTTNSSFERSDDLLTKTYIGFKVRQRGASPILLSAETNETGDKVILTFDKKMSVYGLTSNIIDNGLMVVYSINGGISVTSFTCNDNIIELQLQNVFNVGDDIKLQNDLSEPIESFDYGLLQPFENFPVVNKVVAP